MKLTAVLILALAFTGCASNDTTKDDAQPSSPPELSTEEAATKGLALTFSYGIASASAEANVALAVVLEEDLAQIDGVLKVTSSVTAEGFVVSAEIKAGPGRTSRLVKARAFAAKFEADHPGVKRLLAR